MSAIKNKENIERYYLIDKMIINSNQEFDFDIYTKESREDIVSLTIKKGTKLLDSDVKDLIANKILYVHEDEKSFYEKYYRDFRCEKLIPKDMKDFYKEVGTTVNDMFNHPENLSNMKEAESIVTDMVSTIYEDNFKVSSFITILANDYFTHTHSLNVSVYAVCLGKHMGMHKQELEELGISALLHDLGKSKIKSEIINKNGTLTEHEFHEIKKHPLLGWLLAKKLGISNKNILAGIRNHHEKIDGTGYPDRLKNEEIHIFAKIIGICDIFDALTTKRTYKDSISTFETLILMKKEMSQQLDISIVDHFIGIFREEQSKK